MENVINRLKFLTGLAEYVAEQKSILALEEQIELLELLKQDLQRVEQQELKERHPVEIKYNEEQQLLNL